MMVSLRVLHPVVGVSLLPGWTKSLVGAAGDDEALRLALSACLGMFVKHSSAEEARQVLLRGPLGPQAHTKGERVNHTLVLAAVARSAPER